MPTMIKKQAFLYMPILVWPQLMELSKLGDSTLAISGLMTTAAKTLRRKQIQHDKLVKTWVSDKHEADSVFKASSVAKLMTSMQKPNAVANVAAANNGVGDWGGI